MSAASCDLCTGYFLPSNITIGNQTIAVCEQTPNSLMFNCTWQEYYDPITQSCILCSSVFPNCLNCTAYTWEQRTQVSCLSCNSSYILTPMIGNYSLLNYCKKNFLNCTTTEYYDFINRVCLECGAAIS